MKKPKMPTVVIVPDEIGVQRSLIIAPEDDIQAQEPGHMLLAKIAAQLTLIDNVLRQEAAETAVAVN